MKFASLKALFALRRPRTRTAAPCRYRPALESLEARNLLSSYNIGDVFVGLEKRINHYDSQGNFIEAIPTQGDTTTGMGFDAAGNLYATTFFTNIVQKFDKSLKLVGNFGSGYNGSPESIIFDRAGNAYVGQPDVPTGGTILKFDANGNTLASYSVAVDRRGTDWLQVAPDQHTIYYTSEGKKVLRYDTATRTQLPDFVNNLPGTSAYALRFLPAQCDLAGDMLVADSEQIVLLDPNGTVLRTYDAPNDDLWFAMNINPDGKTFWSGDAITSDVAEFDIATGQLLRMFNAGGAGTFDTPGGIAVAGEIVNPVPPKQVTEVVTYYATAAGAGGGPEVKVYNAQTNALVFDFLAYDPGFLGGVRVATGDVNGDGFPDIITVPGPGGGPNVRVFSGKDLSLLSNFAAFNSKLTTGLFVAAGDTNGDAQADIIVAPDRGAGPNVRVYDGATGGLLLNVMAFNSRFTGGVRVAAGDVNDDGVADVVVGAGPGGGPNVKAYSGSFAFVIQNFMAFDPQFTGGVFVATGRFSQLQDTVCPPHDIVVGAGPGGGSNVRVFDGETGEMLKNFLAAPQQFILAADGLNTPSGVHVSTVDHNGSRFDDLLVSYGDNTTPVVNVYDFTTLNRINFFFPYGPLFQGGIYVASGH